MSAGGPLLAVALGLFFAGLDLALASLRRIDGCALMALGAAGIAGALALVAHGV